MRRRDLLLSALLTAAPADASGTALLLRLADRKLLVARNTDLASRWLVLPGSTIKPFTLLALLQAGKVTRSETFLCTRHLQIAGHNLTCSHPYTSTPMNVSRAIAYSCNCAVAHFAQRFQPGELSSFLARMGFASVSSAESLDAVALQAIGEDHIQVTALELVCAYSRLAALSVETIVEGLEGCVNFGNAQALKLKHTSVAAKTGSARMPSGVSAAWVAGFAPSRSPQVAFTVLLQGRSGGADAAPVAAGMLRSYFGEAG